MSGIIGLTELLKTENTPDKSEQYMKLLSHEENKLLALSEKILLSSKFESSSIKLLENDINVQDFIISFIEPFLIKGDSDIAISYEISKTTPQTVRSDSFWIEQILSNLLENALKYTNKGFIKIHVYAEENAEEIYHINFAVEDSGVGIPEEKLNTIFNEFEQLHQKPATEGVGLGLYICKEAAKAFKGELICDKTGKDGSRFLLSIPIEKPQAESSQLH